MSQQIPLSQNRFALVDDNDFDRLSRSRWSYRAERGGAQGYAIRHVRDGDRYRTEYLQRAVTSPPPGTEVIFRNHDRLDCRRDNLRVVSKQEARLYHRVRRDSRSGVKGVRYNPEANTWSVTLYRGRRGYHVGTYASAEQAAHVFQEAVEQWCAEQTAAAEAKTKP